MITDLVLHPAFAPVRECFASHFTRDDEFQELGAGVCIYADGEKVLECFGGLQDDDTQLPWQEQTLTNIWSASKGIMAIAIAQLVEQGELDYQLPLTHWWPEFGENGKDKITLAQVLSHQAGLNGFSEPTRAQDMYDWQLITSRLARQVPLWQPGSTSSYHGMTFGWLTGELVRRVTGLMPADYFQQFIAAPLEADFFLGLPDTRQHDVASIVPPQADNQPITLNDYARHTVENPVPDASAANTPEWRAAQIPAVNIHATADALARVYAAAMGQVSPALLGTDTLKTMVTPLNSGRDEMLGDRLWGAGVALNTNGLYGPNASAFGHSGWGGSFAFADPQSGISMSYVTRRMGSALNGDPRARNLISSLYDVLATTSR